MLEPTEALESTENALRHIVRLVAGDDWQTKIPGPKRLESEKRQQRESQRRPGVSVSDDLLAFTDFSDLTTLILDQWTTFEPVFGDETRTTAYFNSMKSARNTIAHSRALVPFERELLSGMAGQLRQQITLYRTNINAPEQHYPVIESTKDNFGNDGAKVGEQEMIRLEVGDTIEYNCRAVDPRGRDLEWLVVVGVDSKTDPVWVKGATVDLSLTVTDDDVGESYLTSIFMRSTGRHNLTNGSVFVAGTQQGFTYDDVAYFRYAVNPPMD